MTSPSVTAAAAGPQPSETSRPRIALAFGALALGTILSSWNVTLIAPALPSIVRQFNAQAQYAWVILALAIPAAVVLPVAGKLSDRYGPRRLYILAISIFLAGSIVAAASPEFLVLVLARIAQGIGLGSMQAISQALIGEIAAPRERGKYTGILSAAFGIATVAGPLLGGIITDHLGWRWLFIANVPIGLATIWAALAWVRVAPRSSARSVGGIGLAVLTLSMLTLVFAISAGGQLFPWGSAQFIAAVATSLLLFLILIAVEKRSSDPVIPLRLFATPAFALPNVTMFGLAAGMYGAIYFIPLFGQNVLRMTATESGSTLTPLLVSLIVVSVISGQIISRTGEYKGLVLASIALVALAVTLFTQMSELTGRAELTWNMLLLGMGLGGAIPSLTVVAQSVAPPSEIGLATATIVLSRSMGTVFGVAVMGAIFSSTSSLSLTFGVALPAVVIAFVTAALSPHVVLRSEQASLEPDSLS